jgi:hypothetical protein
MREGSSLQDFEHPPFVLVGCAEARTADVLRSLYAGVDAPFVQTTVRTAEMVKYVCNAFHALKVCFTNEVADLCDSLGADAQEVMRIFRMDRKLNVSEAYLKPGFAFGGSCLPKDVRALTNAARIHDVPVPLLSAIMPANEHQVLRGVEAVLGAGRRRVGIVGLAFKSGTDDLRESPMVTLVERLIGKGYDVRIHDPSVSMARVMGANRRYIDTEIPHIASLLCDRVEELVAHAELLILSAGRFAGSSCRRVGRTRAADRRSDARRGAPRGVPAGGVGGMRCRVRSILTIVAAVAMCLAASVPRFSPGDVTGAFGPGSSPGARPPEHPRQSVDTGETFQPQRTIRVPARGDLQEALDQANPGDLIALEEGATYAGPFRLPRKQGVGLDRHHRHVLGRSHPTARAAGESITRSGDAEARGLVRLGDRHRTRGPPLPVRRHRIQSGTRLISSRSRPAWSQPHGRR